MNRRGFLGALTVAAGGIFVPQFGSWFRRGSGLLVPEQTIYLDRQFFGEAIVPLLTEDMRLRSDAEVVEAFLASLDTR